MAGTGTTRGRRWARGVALAAALAAPLVAAPAAPAAFSIQAPQAQPMDTREASASTRFNLHVEFGGTEHVKDQTTRLPSGLGPNIEHPACSEDVFDDESKMCPANTQVGTTKVQLTIFIMGVPDQQTVPGRLFQLAPQGGFPKLGILLEPAFPGKPARQKAEVRVNPQLEVLENVVRDFPQTAETEIGTFPIRINSIDIVLDKDFIRNPKTCNEARTFFFANSYENPGTTVSGSASYTPTGCAPPPPRRCGGRKVTKSGTGKGQTIVGTKGRDVIDGRGGRDVIRGLGGNDVLCGGAGPDRLLGGAGRDVLLGQAGADALRGGAGRDSLRGGAGRDDQKQ